MHVLGKIDGYLHVSISPDMGFYPQAEASYGYVREKDVEQFECMMAMKYL